MFIAFLTCSLFHLNFSLLAKDRSAEFEREFASSTEFNLVALQTYKILLVPGFFANPIMKAKNISLLSRYGFGEYFDDQLRLFQKQNIESERIKLESENSTDFNVELIAQSIKAAQKLLILIGHSKGNIDILVSLIRYPELHSKVKGWISIQAPFHGSPVADWFIKNQNLSWFARWFLQKIGGNFEALSDLSQQKRILFLIEHNMEIQKMSLKIPILAVGTEIPKIPFKIDTLLWIPRDLMLRVNIPNDGLVPLSGTSLQGSDSILLKNLDHADPVMKSWVREYDRTRMTQLLCYLLLKKIGV